jgi:hypothetical protein
VRRSNGIPWFTPNAHLGSPLGRKSLSNPEGVRNVIRAILGILILIALLFMADQEFANGRYTHKTEKAVSMIRKTIGL